jgi:hypothetical protein
MGQFGKISFSKHEETGSSSTVNKKLDKDEIAVAAQGRWIEILSTVGGISTDMLDNRHHGCHKCGGSDRFRVIDIDVGALFCNQCFNKKNGDGFAAIQWLCDVKFTEALKLVAEFLGFKVPEKAKKKQLGDDIEFTDWNEGLAKIFALNKPGVTVAALEACGAKIVQHLNNTTIAVPVYGPDKGSAAPVGWVLQEIMGGKLPAGYNPSLRRYTRAEKVKVAAGSKPGLMGIPGKIPGLIKIPEQVEGQDPLDPITVWKVEGVSDMLALYEIIPADQRDKHYVTTNSNGTNEKPGWRAERFAGLNVNVIHDADEPGESGSAQWAAAIAKHAVVTKQVKLPYEVTKDHGKDLRDWINEGFGFADLIRLADNTQPISVSKDGKLDEAIELRADSQICEDLQIDVLGEIKDGPVKVFSLYHRKTAKVDVSRWKYSDWLRLAGPPFRAKCHESKEQVPGSHSFPDVIKAVNMIAGHRQIDESKEVGEGVWQGTDEDGHESEAIIISGANEAVSYTPGKPVKRIRTPRADGMLLNFDGGEPWFNYETIRSHLETCEQSRQWQIDQVAEATKFFEQWNWRNQEADPAIVAGMVLATWVQTLWKWRPLVALSGASGSGKTTLFQALGGSESVQGMFGKLSLKSSLSTEAGLRQSLKQSAPAVLCDEFEESRHRTKMLELFRTAGGGEGIVKGSATHKAVEFRLRHCIWVAGIEVGLNQTPDRNRYISLKLLSPEKGMGGKLTLPPNGWLSNLGQKLLAIAIFNVQQAKEITAKMKPTQIDDVVGRVVELYSAPASMLAAVRGEGVERAEELMRTMVAGSENTTKQETTEEALLGDILTAYVEGERGARKQVSEILESYQTYVLWKDYMAAAGVGLVANQRGPTPRYSPECAYQFQLFFDARTICRKLLRDTNWTGKDIVEIITCLPGGKSDRRRIGGTNARTGARVPMQYVQQAYLTPREENEPQQPEANRQLTDKEICDSL